MVLRSMVHEVRDVGEFSVRFVSHVYEVYLSSHQESRR